MSTMVISSLAVLAGALCLLFFILFTRFYFRNRREALALRDRLAAEAAAASGFGGAPDVRAERPPEGGSQVGGV